MSRLQVGGYIHRDIEERFLALKKSLGAKFNVNAAANRGIKAEIERLEAIEEWKERER